MCFENVITVVLKNCMPEIVKIISYIFLFNIYGGSMGSHLLIFFNFLDKIAQNYIAFYFVKTGDNFLLTIFFNFGA